MSNTLTIKRLKLMNLLTTKPEMLRAFDSVSSPMKKFLKFQFWYFVCSVLVSEAVYANDNISVCSPSKTINNCIQNAKPNSIVQLTPSVFFTEQISLKSGITLIVPFDAKVILAKDAAINPKAFGGVSNAVISAKGTPENPLKNIRLIINGEINGNIKNHPYKNGGIEGINFSYVNNSIIEGSGVIQFNNGDGIDLDSVSGVIIKNLLVQNNGGSGVHFGSPRPISGSSSNIVFNITSSNNGFLHKRNGFDSSWPNPYGVSFVKCTAIDNYRNFEIEAIGTTVLNSFSINNGKVIKDDDFSGAESAIINNQNVTRKSLISKKRKVLLERDLRKFLGLRYNHELDGVN